MPLLLPLLALLSHFQTSLAVNSLTVNTTSGPVTGIVNAAEAPSVAQFLGVPFAEPPVNSRRWLPATLKSREQAVDATKFRLSCPQYEGSMPSTYNTDAPEFLTPNGTTGEDCLNANIWVPYDKKEDGCLPVIVWLYGGGFTTGGGNIPYQNPSRWIERSQRHIVVSINYRLNIFGFPNAAGLNRSEQNLGLLDQRLGLEWVRQNIQSFGGDPSRISLWGQSAGAMSVDYYNFAYPTDPIVSGLIMDSGTALLPLGADDSSHTNFTFVATHFGCGNLTAKDELDCLRKINSTAIEAFLKSYADTGSTPSLAFAPIIDNITKFSNYTALTLAGNFSKTPAIIGTNANEGASLATYNATSGPNTAVANLLTLSYFLCPAVKTTQSRYTANVPTYRYLYGGNFSNISPRSWEGAYHSSELPLIFGTHGIVRGESTAFEKKVSEKMQDFWLAFAEGRGEGLKGEGWSAYEPDGEAVLIGWEDKVVQGIEERRLEAPCDGETPRMGAVPPP